MLHKCLILSNINLIFTINNIMKKNIQLLLNIFMLLFVAVFSSFAQDSRVRLGKIETTNLPKQTIYHNNIKETYNVSNKVLLNTANIDSAQKKKSSLVYQNDNKNLAVKTLTYTDASLQTEQQKIILQKQKLENDVLSNTINSTALTNPIFPDFNVNATKETYANNSNTGEIKASKLERVSNIPEDIQENSLPANTTITISPLKRTYFQALIKELEHDISTGDKTTTEIQAKMKEVEDLKKIINQ